jgi:glycyl-tRNA synthetase beta chain
LSDLLLELFCEEIPARMQARAEAELVERLSAALSEMGLSGFTLKGFSGPRRIGVVGRDLPSMSASTREERKGPRVGAPQPAIDGFLRGAGVSSLDDCIIQSDKKGDFYIAIIESQGRTLAEIIAEAVPAIVTGFHWQKSMKFGEGARAQRWVRPLQRILCLVDSELAPFEVFGIVAGDRTEGHRLWQKPGEASRVSGPDDHEATLRGLGVIRDRAERRALIAERAHSLCAEAGLELVEDEALLDEVTGLAEWPVPLLGSFDPSFLDLPPEVIRLTMKVHQKYFAVRHKDGSLSQHFIMVANQDAPDGGKAIIAGAARVLAARLNDARFFCDNDKALGLEAMAGKLSAITFHEKLGSIGDKVARVAQLARHLAPTCGADPDLAERAARLAKADLVSEVVYEFPELQGVMGRYYAWEAGQDEAVAHAIRDHYKPQGPSDAVPTHPVSVALALADKLDTLMGFWAIDEKPTGSKDPFALRRAALGVVRIVLENQYTSSIAGMLRWGFQPYHEKLEGESADAVIADLTAFVLDRLKGVLKEQGIRHDVMDAILALAPTKQSVVLSEAQGVPCLQDHLALMGGVAVDESERISDLSEIGQRARALQAFLNADDGANLVAGWKRAANLLAAEEKKGFETHKERALLQVQTNEDEILRAWRKAHSSALPAEIGLYDNLTTAKAKVDVALQHERFEEAMVALAPLRASIDHFFETVVVNDANAQTRRLRLILLAELVGAFVRLADFNRLEG